MTIEVSLGVMLRDKLKPDLVAVLPLVEGTPLVVYGTVRSPAGKTHAPESASAAHALRIDAAGPSNGAPLARLSLLNRNGFKVFLEGNLTDTAPYVVEPQHDAVKQIRGGHAMMPGQFVGLARRYELWPTPFLKEHQEALGQLDTTLATMEAQWLHGVAFSDLTSKGDGTVAWTGLSLAPPPVQEEPAVPATAAPAPVPEPPPPALCQLELVFSPSPSPVEDDRRPAAAGAWLGVDVQEPLTVERASLEQRHRHRQYPESVAPFYSAATPTPVLAVDAMPLRLARGVHRLPVNMPHLTWPQTGKIRVTVMLHLTGGRTLSVVVEDGDFLPDKPGFGMN